MGKAKEVQAIKGFVIGKEMVHLSHLQYADDTLFFIEGGENNVKSVIDILKFFYWASVLKVNKAKSQLVGIDMNEYTMLQVANGVGCAVRSWLMSYLGSPLGGNPSCKQFWEPIISKITRRLDG